MTDSTTTPQSHGRGITEQQLRRTELPTTSYVCGIPLYPVGGTVFLYGPPGIGKSFITQGMNHSITWGKPAGTFTVDHTANVLYCDFEGTANLVRERSLALTPFGQLACDNGGADMPTDTTYVFAQDWKGRGFPERLAELEERLLAQEEQGIAYSLVVLDTYTAFVGSKPGDANAYDYDRACIEQLNQLADRCQVCILLIHHPNKSGEISGSTGRAGTSWIVMSFKRVAQGQAVLEMEKNRVDRELSLSFDWDAHRIWRLSADMPGKVAIAKGNNRAILTALCQSQEPMNKAQLIAATRMPEGSLKSGLNRLKARGEVELLDGNLWRVTFAPTQEVPAMPAHQPAQQESQLRREPPAAAAAPDPRPKWKQMGNKRTPRETELIEIDASTREHEGEQVWNVSPISRALDLIMADRDAGSLGPSWRAELPKEIEQSLDGQHRWGALPVRFKDEYRHQPKGLWLSYDVRGSFLSAYKTMVAVKPLPDVRESDGREWTKRHAGALEIMMPAWEATILGHPCGSKAQPGQWQWVWSPTYRLLMDLVQKGYLPKVQVRRTALRAGYQSASEGMFDGFQNRMRVAREAYKDDPDKLSYVKEMYSAWLSTVKAGQSNAFKRPDWWYSIRAEAFGRLWSAGLAATGAGIEVVAMGNTDELVMRPSAAIELLFPSYDHRLGKMTLKERGNGG